MAESGSGLSAGWVAALTIVPALVGGLAGFGGAVATGWFSYASKDEELRVRLVEIAITILEADPAKTDHLTPARDWAMDVIDQKSGVKFSDADRAALVHEPITAKDLSAWKDGGKEYTIVPLDGSMADSMKKWFEDLEKDKGAPSK
jgi:hypothetical protein